jgi:xanthine/CO dehydrogenase XdhC/CoxF family maturation factor
VLATIIETQGSTYQKAGAKMLISKDGEWLGLLNGGCFESDLLERAGSVFASGQPVTVFYDMRSADDVIWGLGLGCNGAVRILLQLLKAEEYFYPLNKLVEALEKDRRGVLMTVIESDHRSLPIGLSLFLDDEDFKNSHSFWPGELIASAQIFCLNEKPRFKTHRFEGNTIKVFYEPIRPLPRLFIVGAGADAIPLMKCAETLGWRVTVIDYRQAYIKPERFPLAERLFYCLPQNLAEELPLERFDAAVMMTHNFEYDARYLKIIANSRIPFVGLLGPEARKERLLDSLGDKASKIADRVFGPVGLDIGAETPEEIAISIMAGILAAQNRRRGGQLTSQKTFAYA